MAAPAQTVCTQCGKPATSKFCPEDGAPVVAAQFACPKCGAAASGKFCSNCGSETATAWRVKSAKELNARPDHARHVGKNSGNEWSEKVEEPAQQHNVFGDDVDTTTREEERMNRHADASLGQLKEQQKKLPAKRDDWLISLVGCPQDPGAPVTLRVDEVTVFTSPGNSSQDVTTDVEVKRTKYGVHNINLKLPVMGPQGNITKAFDTKDGMYVKFGFTQAGLAIQQQSWPW